MNSKATFRFLCLLCTCITILFLPNCQTSLSLEKPAVFEFGTSAEVMMTKIEPMVASMDLRRIEPMELPTATQSQTQLDCSGFEFAGKKRNIELIFADDQLDIVWILTEATEEASFIEGYTQLYGAPSHQIEGATFFLDHGVAVRNQPHEILFLSERLQGAYAQWLEGGQ